MYKLYLHICSECHTYSIDIYKAGIVTILLFLFALGLLVAFPRVIEIYPEIIEEPVIEEAEFIDEIIGEEVIQQLESPDLMREFEELELFIEEAEKPLLQATSSQPSVSKPPESKKREMELRRLVTSEAVKNGLDPLLAISIIECESGFVETAQNGESSAGGAFQFINATWAMTLEDMGLPTSSPKYDGEINIKAGIHLLKTSGSQHWDASRHCWGKDKEIANK